MVRKHADHALKVPSVQNQNPIEALGTDRPSEALRDSIRLRRSNRRPNDSDVVVAKYRVEAIRKLVVTIPDQKTDGFRTLRKRPRDLPRLLRHLRRIRI
jgi:hypothetical protein